MKVWNWIVNIPYEVECIHVYDYKIGHNEPIINIMFDFYDKKILDQFLVELYYYISNKDISIDKLCIKTEMQLRVSFDICENINNINQLLDIGFPQFVNTICLNISRLPENTPIIMNYPFNLEELFLHLNVDYNLDLSNLPNLKTLYIECSYYHKYKLDSLPESLTFLYITMNETMKNPELFNVHDLPRGIKSICIDPYMEDFKSIEEFYNWQIDGKKLNY